MAVDVSVVTASRLRPPARGSVSADAESREGTTLQLVTVAAGNVAIVLVAVVAWALLAAGHRERMETPFFVLALALAPLAVALARRQCDRIGPRRFTSLAILDVAGLSATMLAARAAAGLVGADVAPPVLLAGAAFLGGVGVVAHRRPSVVPTLAGRERTAAIAGACVVLGAAALSFFPEPLFRAERLWLCALVALLVAGVRSLRLPISPSRLARHTIDGVVLVATALLVSNMTDYGRAQRYDYDFFLGPVNAMRHGQPLLVDTFSQYGVGIFYALAGAFRAVPFGYGGLQLILCAAYAVEFTLVYAVLRLACKSQLVAVLGLAVAIVANLVVDPPAIAYPSIGPLRFGLPWLVILAGTLRARSTGHRRLLEAAMLLTVAVGAVWSVETFVCCLTTYAALSVVSVVEGAESRSVRSLLVAERIAAAVVAGFLAVAATSAVVLLLTGDWPRWTDYLSFVALYAMRGFGSLLIPTWSPGYLVAALYVLSLTALLALPRAVRIRERPAVAATAGATAFGAIAFTYFLGRSAPSNLHHIAVPAVVVICGWWTIATSQLRGLGRAPTWAAVLVASFVGASVAATSSNAMGGWLADTALVQVMHSPSATATNVDRLLRADEPDPRVVEGARLLDAYAASGRKTVVLIRPSSLTAVLLQARRGNALPIVNGHQDGLLDGPALKRVVAATDRLPEGTVVLTESAFMLRPPGSFARLDPITNRLRFGDFFIARSYAALEERFDLRRIGSGRLGYVVLEVGRHR